MDVPDFLLMNEGHSLQYDSETFPHFNFFYAFHLGKHVFLLCVLYSLSALFLCLFHVT